MEARAADVRREQRVINSCLAGMVALVLLKFLVLLSESAWDPSKAPWGLLMVVVVPAFLLSVLLTRRPRLAAVVVGLLFVLFIAFVVSALLRDGFVRQSWADYPFAYGGLFVALVGVYYTASLIRHGRTG